MPFWKITTLMRFLTESARQFEELCESGDFNFEVSGRLDISGQQSGTITWVLSHCLQYLERSGHGHNYVITIAGRPPHLADVATK
jgi:hypothetical protein